jgi:hypothetical protein
MFKPLPIHVIFPDHHTTRQIDRNTIMADQAAPGYGENTLSAIEIAGNGGRKCCFRGLPTRHSELAKNLIQLDEPGHERRDSSLRSE